MGNSTILIRWLIASSNSMRLHTSLMVACTSALSLHSPMGLDLQLLLLLSPMSYSTTAGTFLWTSSSFVANWVSIWVDVYLYPSANWWLASSIELFFLTTVLHCLNGELVIWMHAKSKFWFIPYKWQGNMAAQQISSKWEAWCACTVDEKIQGGAPLLVPGLACSHDYPVCCCLWDL